MSIKIFMPALSPTMTEGNLVKWLKKEGDSIKAGQVLCEIETDKATMEVEAVDEGILGKIVVAEGTENVQVNALIAILCEEGEDPAALVIDAAAPVTQTQPTVEEITKGAAKEGITHKNIKQDRVKASPLARRLGEQNQLDLKTLSGTGPNGRIVKVDVLEALNNQSCKNAPMALGDIFEDVKVSLMRKTVAKRLTESKNTVPHFYLTVDCEIDKLLDMRAQINQALNQKISVNDMLIKICAKTLQAVPKANVTWHETFMRYYSTCDISVAVAMDGGLVTPIVFGAEKLSLSDISTTMKGLAEKARQGKLQPREYEGGSFTLSNLGMFGIKQFSAIINPPQGCILAVGAGEKRVIVKNDQPSVATMMTVTLSVDHRSVDGALGAEFLKVFKNFVENPILIFV